MEDCLNRGDPAGLVSILHHEGLSSITLSRLDQLVTQVRGCGGGLPWFLMSEGMVFVSGFTGTWF